MDWWFIVSKKKKLFLGWFIVALPTLLMLICKQVECLDIMSVMCIMMFNCAGSCWRWFMSMVHKVVFNMWMRRTVLAIARSTSIEPVVTFLGERSGAIRGLHQLGWRTWLIAASACNNDIVWDPPNASQFHKPAPKIQRWSFLWVRKKTQAEHVLLVHGGLSSQMGWKYIYIISLYYYIYIFIYKT